MRKSFVTMGLVLAISATSTFTAFAGWEQTGTTWKYNSNGTYFNNGWHWIDGNGDNIAECYYFNVDGTILINTITPDSYTVNEQGAWTVNGIVQPQPVPTQPAPTQPAPTNPAPTQPAPKQDTQPQVQPTQPAPQPTEQVVQETPSESWGLGELAPGALSMEEIQRRKAEAGADFSSGPNVEIVNGDEHIDTVGDPVPIG